MEVKLLKKMCPMKKEENSNEDDEEEVPLIIRFLLKSKAINFKTLEISIDYHPKIGYCKMKLPGGHFHILNFLIERKAGVV